MTHKRKIKRIFILAAFLYITINIFIFGIMNAYINTNNTVSKNQLVMASVSENANITNIKILGRSFEIKKQTTAKNVSKACIYALMSEKLRICIDVILNGKELLTN